MASLEAGPCGVPPFCTLHRFAPGPATPRTDDANQADHTDEARRHAPSIANLRSKRRPLRPKHPFFGASGRGGLHVEHNTNNPPHNPVPIGGFYYHRTPMTACRRRVAALWSQFPPDNKNKRGNRARQHALHRLGSTTPLCGTLLWFLRNVARNSPTRISSFEIASLELQRFGASQKVRAPELRASFGLRGAWIEFLCSVVGPTRSSWCPGRINPHAYLRTHAQNHGSTCANGAHTTARPHAPTKIPAFPHQKAKKSPFQQHAVSYNPQVGPNQQKCRLSRTRKPNNRPSSNTICPSS